MFQSLTIHYMQNSSHSVATVSFSCYQLIWILQMQTAFAQDSLNMCHSQTTSVHQFRGTALGTHHVVMLQHFYLCCTYCVWSAYSLADNLICRWCHHNSEPLSAQAVSCKQCGWTIAPFHEPKASGNVRQVQVKEWHIQLSACVQSVKSWGSFPC